MTLSELHPIKVTGNEIGDMLREWEANWGPLSERRWSSAFRAASAAAHLGHVATRAAIHANLTPRFTK